MDEFDFDVAPRFVFLGESIVSDWRNPLATTARALNSYELATRLSYLLWGSMPDDELMRLAGEGKLRANLPAQVKRMLAVRLGTGGKFRRPVAAVTQNSG